MKNVYAATGATTGTVQRSGSLAPVFDAVVGGLRLEKVLEQGPELGLQDGARRRVDATPTFEVTPVMSAIGAPLGLRPPSPPIT
ncbi:hypothetical protein SAMN04488570_3483 [Nocardioides scoriae]|uniref:Uncharacterized protein n=1 Tax=Nocardioides scoriae TaxID=642780 RepID=A0A1H1XH09_9ACTN|nr:hypothetical protein [Nocardioides scoriae]SDT08470.1 hypothetical protein SAMN04488570_3483 [Nocardioides scoriae]